MTVLDRTWSQGETRTRENNRGKSGLQRHRDEKGADRQRVNVGSAERAASVAAGSILSLVGISRRSMTGLLAAGVGGAMIYRGASGHCHAYGAMGIDTAHPKDEIAQRGTHVEQAFLINRSAEDLYRYWRDFQNLPRIMTHLESVQVIDDRKSRWVARAPRIAGGSISWEAEITRDEPNSAIAWRSLPGSRVETAGQVRFSKAMGDRGTEVHVFMDYIPPAGKLGHWIATLFGEAPRRQMRDDLRNFKRIMETGEILTINGQSHGTCTGVGKRSANEV
jgi:uncharacterized membrane protein